VTDVGTGTMRPDGRPPATSASTVAEAAALRRLGLVPAGFVMGTAVCQVVSSAGGMGGGLAGGGPGSPYGLLQPPGATTFPCAHAYGFGGEHWGLNLEDAGYATSVGNGFELVVTRLVEEARALGAHGVVGVDLSVGLLVGGSTAWTFRAVGTAVAMPGRPPPPSPFATTASGQHLERLIALGLVPVALVTGVGACYVQPNCRTRGDPTVPGVVDQLPHAIDLARQRARQTLRAAVHHHGADGVVATDWQDRRVPAWGEAFIQSAVATGTAVRRFAAPARLAPPRPIVSLRP
jgi:uncharacterized protein YbjQ (UPF0145 family)